MPVYDDNITHETGNIEGAGITFWGNPVTPDWKKEFDAQNDIFFDNLMFGNIGGYTPSYRLVTPMINFGSDNTLQANPNLFVLNDADKVDNSNDVSVVPISDVKMLQQDTKVNPLLVAGVITLGIFLLAK